MPTIYILRGAPGVGKSYWVSANNFDDITVSSDAIRLELMPPEPDENGVLRISQKRQGEVWDLVHKRMDERLDGHGIAILDSTAFSRRAMLAYEDLAEKYEAETKVVDFCDVPREQAKSQNLAREELRHVPESVIDRFYDKANPNQIPEWFSVVSPNEAANEIKSYQMGMKNIKEATILDTEGSKDLEL